MSRQGDAGAAGPPPRAVVLDVLRRRGFPAIYTRPTGLLPAVVVWVDEPDDPALHLLPRAFGGHLMLELRDHHGEPTPSFWLGVGRSAVLASHALAHALALAPARRTAGARVDSGNTLLGRSMPGIWAEFEELCDVLLRPDQGSRPVDAPGLEDIAEATEALTRRVDEALPIASHIAGGLALAFGGALREEERASAAHVLPRFAERARWVDAFIARLEDPA